MNNVAGYDRYGRKWLKGLVFVNNGGPENIVILDIVKDIETGKSYFDTTGTGWLHCRPLNADDLSKLPLASTTAISKKAEQPKPKKVVKNKSNSPTKPVKESPILHKFNFEKTGVYREDFKYELASIIEDINDYKGARYFYVNADGSLFATKPFPIISPNRGSFIGGADAIFIGYVRKPSNYKVLLYKFNEIKNIFEKNT